MKKAVLVILLLILISLCATAYALVPTRINFPLPSNLTWYMSTYDGHGSGAGDSSYSAVDITLANGSSCLGQPVYAMASGTVIDVTPSDGRVVVKVTTPLVTTNGVYYSGWYYVYAHMSRACF